MLSRNISNSSSVILCFICNHETSRTVPMLFSISSVTTKHLEQFLCYSLFHPLPRNISNSSSVILYFIRYHETSRRVPMLFSISSVTTKHLEEFLSYSLFHPLPRNISKSSSVIFCFICYYGTSRTVPLLFSVSSFTTKRLEQFLCYSVLSVAMKHVVICNWIPGSDSFIAIHCSENVIFDPLLSNGRLLRLQYSGFRSSCHKILWHINPLIGNDSVNIFPLEQTSTTIGHLLLGNGSVNKPSQQKIGCAFCVVRAEGL
jgi:hypothetical protein